MTDPLKWTGRPGIYLRGDVYVRRPWVNGKRTERVMKAKTLVAAIKEMKEPLAKTHGDFEALVADYKEAGYPTAHKHVNEEKFRANEDRNLIPLVEFFGSFKADNIGPKSLREYHKDRRRGEKKGERHRLIDLEIQTLSNVLNFAVEEEQIDLNKIKSRRKFVSSDTIRHSHKVAPASADQIHQIADHLLDSWKSQSLGMMVLLASLTGLRSSELRALRMDAKPGEPGYVKDGVLHIERSKRGINPEITIFPELEQFLECHARWHAERYPLGSPWMFPGRKRNGPLDAGALGHAMARACAELKIDHITPHGLRSFRVTALRRERLPSGDLRYSDRQVAEMIGDQTEKLIQEVYGKRIGLPKEQLSCLPKDGLPAWARWSDPAKKLVQLKVNEGKT